MDKYKDKTEKELRSIIDVLEKRVDELSSQLHIAQSADLSSSSKDLTPSDTFIHSISNVDDTTLRHLARYDEMKRINSIMDAVLNNLPVYIFMKDSGDDFRYIYWNETFAQYSSITIKDAIGKTDADIFPNDIDVERFRRDDLNAIEDGAIEFFEEYTTKNGDDRIVKTIKRSIPSGGEHPYILGVSWDVTDVKKTEKELIKARVKAEEAEKLKTAFLSNMSHEIRTPLNAIVGFSSLIAHSEVRVEQQQYAGLIEKNSDILLTLINDILDLSALEAGSLELTIRLIRVKDVCTHLYKEFMVKTPPNVQLILDPVDEMQCIETDWKRIVQVGENLLSNALKFTTSGEIHIGFTKKKDIIQFYVKDTGVGIPAKKTSTIFERFDKANQFVQGTGLGLTICRKLVERLGGQIWVQSKVGKGSTFYFTLPITQGCVLL